MAETENDPENLDDESTQDAKAPAVDATAPEAPKAEAKPKRTRAKAKPAAPAADSADAADEPAEKPKRARRKPAAVKADAEATTAEVSEREPSETPEKPKPRRTRKKAEPDQPAAPARKKRPAHDWGDNPPMVRAHAKYVRTSARKARLVCDHIRGKDVTEARAILAHASRHVARDWSKLLESAVANAEHNHELIGDELRIAAVKADEGPTLKRFRPRAMGRATKIRKRTSHLSITLTPKDGDR